MEEHYNELKAAVYLYLTRQRNGKDEILLQLRRNTGYMDGKYDLAVSGHIERGESLSQALIRETKEEIGLEISVSDAVFLALFDEPSAGYMKAFFGVKNYTGDPKVMEPEKCGGLLWSDPNDLPKNIIPYLPLILKNIELGIVYNNESTLDII